MKQILVTYATRAGSTAEVAACVAEELRTAGAQVETLSLKDIQDIHPYDAVIIGSAIRMGRWLPEAVEFVKTHRERLSQIPTAYFLVSGFLREDTPEMRKTVLAYLNPVRTLLEPTCIGLFAGKMDYHKLRWLDRTIAKGVGSAEGDWRDSEAIRTWAHQLLTMLVPA